MAKDKLKESIIENSINKDREKAKWEWEVINSYLMPWYTTCLCGKYPISEVCELQNKNNSKKVMVGNDCVKYFFDADHSYIYSAIKKIEENINNVVNDKIIIYALEKWRIDATQKSFYILMRRRKDPWEYQLKVRQDVNKILLEHFIK